MKTFQWKRYALKIATFLVAFQISVFTTEGQEIPVDYYQKATGLSGAELKTALHKIIKVGKRLSYGSGSGSTWSGFEKTDVTPDGYVWDMYSYNKVPFPGGGKAAAGMNIEHSVAKSWWGRTENDAYKDLYHLNPSNSVANSARSSYPLGVVKGDKVVGSLKIGNNSYGDEYSGMSFEPLDEYKGDFARAYLYMFTCYEDYSWSSDNAKSMLKSETYPMLRPWAAKMLLEWSAMDPPSEKELKRAAEIFKIQENRNPFIDYPELAEYLWGEKAGEPFFFTETTDPYIVTPSNNAVFSFNSIHYQETAILNIPVRALNLTSDLKFTLSGEDANLYGLSVHAITAQEAQAGITLQVSFHPVKATTSEVKLQLTSDQVATRSITLTAEATDNFSSLTAENITNSSFTARWTPSSLAESYQLSVYTKKLVEIENALIADNYFVGKIPNEWNQSGSCYFTDDPTAIRLATGKNPGGISSPAYNFTRGGKLKITAKQWSNDGIVSLKVMIGANEIANLQLSEDYQAYELNVPSTVSPQEISLLATAGKRLFIKQVEVYGEGSRMEERLLEGYPKELDVCQFDVKGLAPNTAYYYVVTPIYEGALPSQEMNVTTTLSTGLLAPANSEVQFYHDGKDVRIESLHLQDRVQIYDVTGKILKNLIALTSSLKIELEKSGLYIFAIQSVNGHFQIEKILIP